MSTTTTRWSRGKVTKSRKAKRPGGPRRPGKTVARKSPHGKQPHGKQPHGKPRVGVSRPDVTAHRTERGKGAERGKGTEKPRVAAKARPSADAALSPVPAVSRVPAVSPVPAVSRVPAVTALTANNVAPKARFRLIPGGAGDHASVYVLMSSVLGAPTAEAFSWSLEDPFYEPTQRLVVKHEDQVVAHLHVSQRTMRLDGCRLPVGEVAWLVTLPEYRERGFCSRLVAVATRRLDEDGTLVAFTHTNRPTLFARHGWLACGAASTSTAPARELLARLAELDRGHNYVIRPWRQVELPALARLYEQDALARFGAVERSEAYWRWLVTRQAFDHLFVVTDGPDRPPASLADAGSSIVGYAILRERHVAELIVDPRHPVAAEALLARACREAIERDTIVVSFHGPSNHPLQGVFDAARSVQRHAPASDELRMARVSDPLRLLETLGPAIVARAQAAGLPRSWRLGLDACGQKLVLSQGPRGLVVRRSRSADGWLRPNGDEFVRMLLGQCDFAEAHAQRRLTTTSRRVLQLAGQLFPQQPLWRSPADDAVA